MEESKRTAVNIRLFFPLLQWLLAGILSLNLLSAGVSHNEEPGYEMLVFVYADHIGSAEMPSIIRGTEIYLPVVDVFHFLGINVEVAGGFSHITGFFINRENTYSISQPDHRIIYRNKSYPVEPENLIRSETNVYLRSDYFEKIFGLECKFNFRALSVSIRSETELPKVRKKRQEAMRANLSQLKREQEADKVIGPERSLFNIGTADWSVNSRQEANGRRNTWVRLGVGGSLAGGELEGQLNYNNNYPLRVRNQYYRWRYVNNDLSLLRQVVVGKIGFNSVSTIFTPVTGVQASNKAATKSISFGTYTLEDYTEPGWIVELYVNSVLVDYAKADASGYFSFDIPLIYGNTEITVRYYSSWGEEKAKTRSFNIPHVLLPPRQLEYTVSSGIVQDGTGTLFSQGRLHYGLSRFVTVGGGLEYLSSVSPRQYIPFFNTSVHLSRNILFTGEYAHGVRYKSGLSYLSPSRLRFEINHTQYEQDQKAVRYNYTRETTAAIGMPFRLFKAAAFNSRLTLSRSYISAIEYSTAGFELSGSLRGMSLRIHSLARSMQETNPHIYTDLSTSFLMPGRFIFDARTRYEHNNEKFTNLQLGLKRNLFGNGNLTLSYERNFSYDLNFVRVGLLYNLPFASLGFASTYEKNGFAFYESASGSLTHERRTGYVDFSSTRSTGRGGIILLPFLDLNANKKRDPDEPLVKGLNVRGNGHIEKNDQDGTIVITGLEPYTNYFVELDANGFDNIAWRINQSSLSIAVEPNRLRLVEIPVAVAGEASGMTYLNENGTQRGIGRIKICFYDMSYKLVASTLSESDGYFNYLGLPPGLYHAKIDSAQLSNLQMSSRSGQQSFVIRENEEGDFVDDLEFILQKSPDGDTIQALEEDQPAYGVQLMASRQKISLNHPAFKGLKDVRISYQDGIYTYTWNQAGSMEHARILANAMRDSGFTSASIVPLDQNEKGPVIIKPESLFPTDEPLTGRRVYKVQLLATPHKLQPTDPVFQDIKDIQVYYHDGMYKYTWGEVRSIEHARILQNELKDRGFAGAFIVPFDGEERIGPETDVVSSLAINLPETHDLEFRLQIIATTRKISTSHAVFRGLEEVKVYYHNNMYKYTWGSVKSIEHARILQNELKNRGFTGAFIVPFFKNERVWFSESR